MALKGIPCEFVAVNLLENEQKKEPHLMRNPIGQVPVLEILDEPESSSRRFLIESIAIMEWLEELKSSPSILPRDPLLRARARALAEIINSGTQPIQNLFVQQKHSQNPEERKAWAQYFIERGLSAYEKIVSQTAGRFSVGDSITVADLCLIPQSYNAARFDVDLNQLPMIKRITELARSTEACLASAPERFEPKISQVS